MIALDTNLLARLLLRDDAAQHARARQLLSQEGSCTAPITVKQQWVRVPEVNGCTREDRVRGWGLLLGLRNFKPQEPLALRQALAWYAQGLDFADALHLALRHGCEEMAAFDKAFAGQSKKLGASPPVRAL